MMRRLAFAGLLWLAVPAPLAAQHWVGSWASSQQAAEPSTALRPDQLTDVTLRQLMRVTIGGPRLRIRLSNAFGTAPLRLESVPRFAGENWALPYGYVLVV